MHGERVLTVRRLGAMMPLTPPTMTAARSCWPMLLMSMVMRDVVYGDGDVMLLTGGGATLMRCDVKMPRYAPAAC